jgi:hypothetical protein
MSSKSVPASAAVAHLEQLAKTYRQSLDILAHRVTVLNAAVQAAQDRHMPDVRLAIAAALDAQAKVIAAIDQRRDLFVKPRSMTLCGIKLGIGKQRGRTKWPKTEKLLAAMKRVFSPATYKGFVVAKEEPNKAALANLPAPELKKLGVTIVDTGDAVFAEPAKSTIDQQVAQLLDDAADEQAEKARAAA